MRVFLDTKSNALRVELAQGAVAHRYKGGKKGEPGITIECSAEGEVLSLRIAPLDELMEELELVEKPQA